jgi:hypothetical protein
MDTKTRTILLWSGVAVLVIAGVAILFTAFGGSEDPVDDVNVVYTDAAATVAAQQLTLQVGTLSATPTQNLGTPTVAPTLLPSSTQQQTPAVLPTAINPASPVATVCDNSVYISDVTIPDGTVIPAGQSFTKTWKVSNTGTCAWTTTYQLVFIAGDSLGGKATAIGKVVNPGETADVSVVLTSTSATGTITGTWKLTNDKGQPFGTQLTVVISNGVSTTTTATTAPVATTAVPTTSIPPTEIQTTPIVTP